MSESNSTDRPDPDAGASGQDYPGPADTSLEGFDLGGLPGGDPTFDDTTEPPTDLLASPSTTAMEAGEPVAQPPAPPTPPVSGPSPVGPPPGAPMSEPTGAQSVPRPPYGSAPYGGQGTPYPAGYRQAAPGQPYPPQSGQQQPANGHQIPGQGQQPPRPWEPGGQPPRSGVRPGCVAGVIGAVLALGLLLTALVIAMRNLTEHDDSIGTSARATSPTSDSSPSASTPAGGKGSAGATPLGGPATALPEKGRTVRLEVVSTGSQARISVMKNSSQVVSSQDEVTLPYAYEMPFTTGESDRYSVYANPPYDERPRPTMECRVYLDGQLVAMERSRDYGVSCNLTARDIVARDY
ncbi:MAG: hypothetical protein LWW86_06030 [Micrococcales bacterium]|nr:hypothetical protein [Micrococcales bacterium]